MVCPNAILSIKLNHFLRFLTGNPDLVNLKKPIIRLIVKKKAPKVISRAIAKIICFVILFPENYFFNSFTASISFGRTFIASPTIPYCAASKIGASLSELMATMYFDELIPARCCVAPEIPTAI